MHLSPENTKTFQGSVGLLNPKSQYEHITEMSSGLNREEEIYRKTKKQMVCGISCRSNKRRTEKENV
jgi:hypothetical protein